MRILLLILCGWLVAELCAQTARAQDIVIADFESERYDQWTVTGECFGSGPASGTLPGQMPVDGYRGQRLVNTFLKGDSTTGTLTSAEFSIERNFIAFLIGGGHNEQKLALQLLVDDQVVRSSTGPNDRPGGSETLAQDSWDVAQWKGKRARLRIIDEAQGGWGHINVDHIVQTDKKPAGLQSNVERTMVASAKYLMIPIRNGAPKRVVTCLVDGQQIVRNDIELADGPADWWAPMDISQWKEKKLTLRVDKLAEDSSGLSSMRQADRLDAVESLYREPLRGQFHFSPKRGWNNDPNGLVYFKGEYHLFFQHNPYGWGWGNMHWGHAISRDLVHWQELGDVLLPDEQGPMFSGSAVVDWQNTSGFGKDGQAPLVLIYTAAGNPTVQCLAYSLDGRTFTKYSGNPVLPQVTGGNRDPKVFWHQPTRQWVMVLYVEWQKKHTVHFFTSSDLKEWKLASINEGDAPGGRFLFECPDFFELPIDQDSKRKSWVLTAADSGYAIGDFDGSRFVPEQQRLIGHRGKGFYAAQTFSDIPSSDGRRIQIGWFQTETRGMPFNQSMTIPLELRLISTADGPRMTFAPIKELEQLRTRHQSHRNKRLKAGEPITETDCELVELRAEIEPGQAESIVFQLRGVTVEYDCREQILRLGDHKAPAPLRDNKLRLTAYVDRTGLELFASDGLCYIPWPENLAADNRRIAIEARGGEATVAAWDVFQLRSAWRDESVPAPGR